MDLDMDMDMDLDMDMDMDMSMDTSMETMIKEGKGVETRRVKCELKDSYDIDLCSILGKGAFSVVYGGVSISIHDDDVTHNRVAIKCVPKSKLKNLHDIQSLHSEVRILQRVSHENIVTFYNFFDERHHYYLVTELIDGGELFDRILLREFYNEARDLVRNLVRALAYLHHEQHVAHRDVKPENLVLLNRNSDSDVRLVDFGAAGYCV